MSIKNAPFSLEDLVTLLLLVVVVVLMFEGIRVCVALIAWDMSH